MTTSVQSNPFDDKINEDISIQAGSSLFDLNRITNNKNGKIITNPDDYAWLDVYDDDEAEQKFLSDKPKCFLVVGKPGSGKTTIAKKIAEEWRAELISPTDLIQQNIEQGTELGKKAREIFLKGESVSGNMVCEMISTKINSPEVLHHGYVLDGFPSYSEPSLDVQQQMEMLLNWKLQPDFIIHLKVPDNDLIERRVNQKVDPYTGNIYIKDVYRPPAIVVTKNKNEDEDEEEEMDDEEENNAEEEEAEPKDEFFAELPNDVVERLVTRPEDSEPNVLESLKLYKDALLRALETHMANMDQSYLFELDANVSPTVLIKQIVERLETFQISKAAKSLRLSDPPTEIPEEEPPLQTGLGDPVETEEVMQSLAVQQKLSNKFKWRRSKWMRFCPVSLKNGAIINGRPECAAAFLDKVYAMANEQTLKEFLKNPREYIKLPYPRAPCKLSILGDIYSGKTVLANLLAKKYNAKVLDMNLLIQPKIKGAKDELLARIKEDTVKTAIETVKQKVREIMEQERIKKEQAEQLLAQAAEEKELEEKEIAEQSGEIETTEGATESSEVVKSEEIKPIVAIEKVEPKEIEAKNEYLTNSFITITDENDVIVDVNHPDVLSAVETALAESSKQLVSLPPSDYIEVLEQEIKRVQEERQKLEPNAPSQGGWILDNFPVNTDQLNAMIESNIVPDTFIVLKDSTANSSVITKRWYNVNKTEIDKKIEIRMKVEQEKRAEELMKKELEKARRIREGEDVSKIEEEEAASERAQAEDDEESRMFSIEQAKRSETLEKIPEEDESKDGITIGKHLTIPTVTDEPTAEQLTLETGVEPAVSEKEYFPTKGPEVDEFLKFVKENNEKLKNLQNSIANLTGNDAILVDVNKGLNLGVELTHKVESKSFDDLFSEASMVIERIFKYKSNEYEGGEEEEAEADEEEEEEAGEEEEDAEEEEEEEGDPTIKDKNIQLGDTNHYCPVTLFTRNMLIPGNPEIQAKYREKIYRFTSDDNRQLFIENSEKYLPTKKPPQVPPIRLLVLGPRGAGKSIQARKLADKLDLFHIKFRDRLQELIIGKLKKPVGPEYEEENEEDEEDLSEEEKKKKAEIVPPELTEMEEIIRGYLEKDEALTNDILDNIIGVLWNLEPYKSRGFVLEGFPSNENEVNYLLEKGLFADAALFINVTDDTIVKRLLPAKLDKWRQKMKAKKERREQKKQQKKKELEEKMKRRKFEILYDREQIKLKKEAAGEEVAEEEEDDIEALVQEEFQDELQEEEVEEDQPEEEAKDAMINEFKASYENQMASIEAIKETFQEVLLPRLSVDGNRKENIVRYLISKKLQKFIDYRESIFERAYPIKYNLAKKLCDFGYKRESRFGKWCPVKLLNGDVFPPLYDDKVKPFPVSYRSYIYYLSSKEAREKFIKNPLLYLKQPSPMPVTPLKLSIIGPPKSGKTTLANRFCKEYGCVRLSIGEAIRMVLEKQPKTDLAKKIKEFLIKGKTVPDELSIQCLEVALLNSRCQTRGFILDGFPVTKQQVKFLTDRYIIPFKVIELKCDIKEMLQRNVRDLANPELKEKNIVLNTSPEIVAYKYHEWKNEVTVIREWYTESHKNYCQIDGNQSKWLIWDQAKLIAKECVRQIQVYLSRTNTGQAASIANMCVTYEEMANRLGDFGQYCPVSLAEKNELVDCSSNKTMDFVAEFQGYYYKMFSARELEQFLSNPEKYIPPQAQRKLPLPELLPQKRTAAQVKEMFTKPAELNGYCPVTYYDGKLRYEALEKGNTEYAVEYRNKLFLMATSDAQDKFLRKPELYAFLKLPHKLPPVKEPMNIFNLPMLGYLEQTVAELLIKSLTAVGTFKPKFPFISPTRSSLLYLAYYLKAYNPKSSEYRKKKYKQKLTYFEENCQLIHYLATKTTIKYKEVSRLPYDFQAKYESFFALKENVPTMNWLA